MYMRLTWLALFIAFALPVTSVAAERDVSGGMQNCYRHWVPHTTATGVVLHKFDPNKSFLPLGVWSIGIDKLKQLSEAGFNTLAWAGIDRLAIDEPAGRAQILKAFAANNIQLAPAHMPKSGTLRALVNEPSILAYLPIDEPNRFLHSESDPIEKVYQELLSSRRRLRSIDPNRAMWVNLVPRHFLYDDPPQVPWWYAFNEVADVTSTDCYEIVGPESDVRHIATTVADQVLINQDRAPSWFICQGHKDKRMLPHPDNVLPTVPQFRAEVYTAIVHGATGIFVFKLHEESWPTHPGIGPDMRVDWGTPEQRAKVAQEGMVITEADVALSKELWKTSAAMNAELTSLKNVIFSPTVKWDYRIFVSEEPGEVELPIRTLLKNVGGDYYLFAVNIENRQHVTRIEMPKAPRELTAMFGLGRSSASISGASITDTFEPLGVRVYCFKMD